MKKIIVAVDFSSITSSLIDKAIEIAVGRTSRIYIMHIAAPDPDFIGYINSGPANERHDRAKKLKKEKKELENIAERLKSLDIDVIPLLIQGATAETILSETQRLETELLIMGTHGHGLTITALLGSTSHQVLESIACPLLLVPYQK